MRFRILASSLAVLQCIAFLPGAMSAEPEFPLTADSQVQPGVPKGDLIKDTYIAQPVSEFPGTTREYTVYIPAGLDKSKPVPFMVFQDGVIYQAPTTFDNLIAQKAIPPLVGIFIKPGVVPAANENALPRFNRSFEYDSVTDRYAKFLLQEMLPALEKKHGLSFSSDPNQAAIAGNSSGGIAAFMVAWHRPDRFRRVFTGVGTYVGIRGADALPVMVRKMEPKPIRVYLQSGTQDNNLYCGDWWMANQTMERSLTWAGYEVDHAWGEGGHNGKHATQVFPAALKWLWADWQTAPEVKADAQGKSQWKGYEVVDAGGWETVGKIASDQWLSMNDVGDMIPVGDHIGQAKLHSGKPVKVVDTKGEAGHVRGSTLSPDQTLLYLSQSHSNYISSWALQADGTFQQGQDFYRLDSFADLPVQAGELCVDKDGRLYAATSLGVQVCDQAGRVNFILPTPEPARDVCFGGKDFSELYVVCGEDIKKRRTKVSGAISSLMPPMKPAAPKL